MKLSWNWVKRYWKTDGIEPDEYIKRFDTAGLTVEGEKHLTSEHDGVSTEDTVWDIDIPPYRNDLLCMMWNAKESGGLFNRYYMDYCLYGAAAPSYAWLEHERPERHDLYLSLTLHATTPACTLLQARVVNEVDPTGELHGWMRDAVIALGFEPSNIYRDLEIFCGRNMGQPLFILDLAGIPSKELTVCEAMGEGSIVYEGKSVWYEPGDVVVASGGRVIGIAGVAFDDAVRAGGSSTGVIVLSGVFDKDVVLTTMRRKGLFTWQGELASYGSNHGSVDKTVDNAVSYLFECAGASRIEGATKLTLMDTQRRYIRISMEQINAILDADYTYDEIVDGIACAELLAFDPDEDKNWFYVKLPSYHVDEYACDIAQMIINFLGYDRIGCALKENE